ncbi:MAG: amidohydrolase [Clostridiales bacterium]|jgi:aminobenzoyl-glutamate utilization protein B|nr:amidohydrolase [Clostridiales bacterium]
MTDNKQFVFDYIDNNAGVFTDVSRKIWEYAELSLKEHASAALYCNVLRDFGFDVEEGICGMPTAFLGRWGSGRPVIGILGEYDALSGCSQKAGTAVKEELVPGGPGHGCGHNMLGAGSLAAACAVKAYLEKKGGPGTVIYYGCPGEEGGAGKAFMARENVWRDLDAALTWHPEDKNGVFTGSSLACIQKEYIFKGLSSHAASTPHLGRSALDAVQLMNMGVEFMREHMSQDCRVHYAITDGGGVSPNVVQPVAKVLYMVRSTKVSRALALQERVDKIARAAAMMTETELSVRFIDGLAELVPNCALEELLYENLLLAGAPSYTEDEWAFARALVDSYEVRPDETAAQQLSGVLSAEDIAFINEKSDNCKNPLLDFVIPYKTSEKCIMGSTDVGDVSWQTPTSQITAACFPNNCPGHSWQNVSSGASSIGDKGLLYAGKVIAACAVDLFEDPGHLRKAREEFEKRTAAGYDCPIPPDAVPTPV